MIIEYIDKHDGFIYRWDGNFMRCKFPHQDEWQDAYSGLDDVEGFVRDGSHIKRILNDAAVLPEPLQPTTAPDLSVESETGDGKKNDAGKLRFDLLPVRPCMELARVYTIGAAKYAPRGWEKGIAWGRIYAAMLRHAFKWWGGEKLDPTDGQHHLASVAWCALALIEYEETHPELDDRARAAVKVAA